MKTDRKRNYLLTKIKWKKQSFHRKKINEKEKHFIEESKNKRYTRKEEH